ncbi:hypothetical protein NDK47_02915 [Brevibacillus ruminantium]|uniref:Uncharacterized protein n=1 Tax=Brevibacillus ruminantium TaxID=2950604 RepID=A0ABY4WHK8_9BACL|nr:hypothetical protein [Brevibacillus ruminantium]USG66301.1 hypothetical protein NDK47_02915 [Brevibacillus ruminantium]
MNILLALVLTLAPQVVLTDQVNTYVIQRNEQIGSATSFLQEKGYQMKAALGLYKSYTLTNELLVEDEMAFWFVQPFSPDEYIGKKIQVYWFEVTNHPLEKRLEQYHPKGVSVFLFMSGNKVIGGTSFPITEEPLYGGPYYLDGSNGSRGEEYIKESDSWRKKYSPPVHNRK